MDEIRTEAIESGGESELLGLSEDKRAERDGVREHLRRAYGVDSMFVRVKTLARILGIAPATIYASMRAGRFAMPHVVLCSAPLVRADHLVEWICASRTTAQTRCDVNAMASATEERAEPQEASASGDMTARQLRKRLVAETLARMRIRQQS